VLTNDDVGYIVKGPYAKAFSTAENVKSFSKAGTVPFTMRPYHELLALERRGDAVRDIASKKTGLDFSSLKTALMGRPTHIDGNDDSTQGTRMSQESQESQRSESGRPKQKLGKKSDAWAKGPMTADEVMEALQAKQQLKEENEARKAEKTRIRNGKAEQKRLGASKLVEELKCIVSEQASWEMKPAGMLCKKHLEAVHTLIGRKRLRNSMNDLIEGAKEALKWNEREKSFAERPLVSILVLHMSILHVLTTPLLEKKTAMHTHILVTCINATHTCIHAYTAMHTHIHAYIHMYACMCVCD
jgi:hypothetical protein